MKGKSKQPNRKACINAIFVLQAFSSYVRAKHTAGICVMDEEYACWICLGHEPDAKGCLPEVACGCRTRPAHPTCLVRPRKTIDTLTISSVLIRSSSCVLRLRKFHAWCAASRIPFAVLLALKPVQLPAAYRAGGAFRGPAPPKNR